jgi:acyl carrier protein
MSNSATYERVCTILLRHNPAGPHPAAPVTIDDALTDLGIDSLELLSLGASMEREFDIDIDDATLASATSVRDLLTIVETALERAER